MSLKSASGFTRPILVCSLLVLMGFFLLVTAAACSDVRVDVTVVNNSDVPIMPEINGEIFANPVRPGVTHTKPVAPQVLPGTWPGGPTTPPPNYVFKAYEFVPGEGNFGGWIDENGKDVLGGVGELVFAKTYTWKELEKMKFTFIITRNVFPTPAPLGR